MISARDIAYYWISISVHSTLHSGWRRERFIEAPLPIVFPFYISWFNSSVSFFMHFIKRLKWSFSIKIKVEDSVFLSTKGKIIFLLECYCRLSHKISSYPRFLPPLHLSRSLYLEVNFRLKKSLLRLLCSHSSTHLCAKYQFSIHLHWLNESCSCRNKGKRRLIDVIILSTLLE